MMQPGGRKERNVLRTSERKCEAVPVLPEVRKISERGKKDNVIGLVDNMFCIPVPGYVIQQARYELRYVEASA
jgi:hypothetical protein